MNKIYKVIWSKVKNCYVVASELAKSHTKSPKTGVVGNLLEHGIMLSLCHSAVCVPMITAPVAFNYAKSIQNDDDKPFKITVAAIVKNEAENVPTWVQAARSCADEIVVVDTGSTDGTVERFRDYGIHCYHYDWNDDFASAKNYMISLCHGDWIVLLDGDEWFREGCDVRKAIAKHHNNPITKAIIADWICLDKDRNNAVMFSGGAVRAFRNQPDVRYFRKVHENLTIGYENFAFEPEFKMYHTGYSGSVNRSKHERNLRIMRTMFDFDNGKVEYPTDWRYIEDTYAGLGDYPKALWAADKMISFGIQEYSAAAWITKFNVLFVMKTPLAEMKKQFEYCFRTVPSVSGFRFLASIYYFRNGQIALGLDNYIEGLRMLMGPQDKVAMEHTYWRMYMSEASALASAVYLKNKQVEAALYVCKVCEQYCGTNDWTNTALADVRRVINQTEEGFLGNISERVLPVLQFGKKAVLATTLASSLTIGMVNNVYAAYTAGCGSASGNNAISIGNGSTTRNTNANGSNSIAIGGYTNSPGMASVAIGYNARAGSAVASYALSLGSGAFASASCSVAIGYMSSANSENEISFGHADGDLDANGNAYYGSLYRKLVNVADGTDAHDVVTVGQLNTALANIGSPCFEDGVVLGGYCNTASGCYSSVAGGLGNDATGYASFAAGGHNADAKGDRSTAIGGSCGTAEGSYSLLLGGSKGHAYADYSTAIGGGITGVSTCSTTAKHSVAVGWGAKTTTDYQVTIGSCSAPVKIDGALTVDGTKTITDGTTTRTWSDFLLAGGGGACFANGMVLAGCNGTASGCYSSVAGGCNNRATGDYSTVSGGYNNGASQQFSSVSGGLNNSALCYAASVSGGCGNYASGCASSVAGGISNQAIGNYSFVAGGCCNIASACCSTIVGGYANKVSGNVATIVGGTGNFAGNAYTYIDLQGRLSVLDASDSRIDKSTNPPTFTADDWNPETNSYQTVTHTLTEYYGSNSSVFGGYFNSAVGYLSTAVGGCTNSALGSCSTVVGGERSVSYAQYSTAIGGGITGNAECSTTASGSVAIGKKANTTRDYEVAIGSSCAPVKIDGALTVDGAKTVTDGTTTKSWSDLLNASGSGSSGGSTPYIGICSATGFDNETGDGAVGPDSIAIGACASTLAAACYSIAFGTCAQASCARSVAIGNCSRTNGANAVAIGSCSLATCNSVSIGYCTYGNYSDSVSVGYHVTNAAQSAVAVGAGISNSARESVVLGSCVTNVGNFSIVIGANASNYNGPYSSGSQSESIVIGVGSSNLSSTRSTLIGHHSTIGSSSCSNGGCYNSLIGACSSMTGGYNVGIGSCLSVTGYCNIAIGQCSSATGSMFSTALGAQAYATCSDATALGSAAYASAGNSVAIGNGSAAAVCNVISVGHKATDLTKSGSAYGNTFNRRIINVANGIDDTDVVTVGQLNTAIANVGGGGTTAVCFADGVVLAGCTNTASGSYSAVTSGCNNIASGCYSWAGGGEYNTAGLYYSYVNSDGVTSYASPSCSYINSDKTKITILGNEYDIVAHSGSRATSIGGWHNVSMGDMTTVVGGYGNYAVGTASTITGGGYNQTTGSNSSITGGLENTAKGNYSVVSSGSHNLASGCNSWVAGGCCGIAYACYSSSIGGGIAGVQGSSKTALGSVAIGKNATTSTNYQVAIGSACAPVKIGGDMTVTGTNTVSDGTNSKTWSQLLTLADTDTHYTTHLYVGSGTAANAATTNGNTKITVVDNSTVNNSVTIKGTGATTVISDANGVITVNSTDNNTTYSAGTGLSLSGTTFSVNTNGSIASGNTGVLNGGTVYSEVRPTADGTFAKKANTTAANITALDTAAKNAIKGLSVSGTTITYTKSDGTTGTITTQDTNTTYGTGTADNLTTGTDTTNKVWTSKVLADYVKGQVATETTNRTIAVSNEATARSEADTALSNRIGSLTADGNYIKKSATNNVSANLTALDTQLKTTATAVSTETTNRTNADTTLGNRIGTVSADGNYIKASTSKNIAENIGLLDTAVKANATSIANEVTNRITAVTNEATARSNADTALGTRIDNVVSAYESADTGLRNRIGSLTADGNYIKKSDTKNISENLGLLDTQLKTTTTAVSTEATTRANADTALGTRIDGTIKGLSVSGRTITYTKGDGTKGTITTQDTTYSAGSGLSLSNGSFSVNTNGTVASGNTGIVTGGTVYDALEARLGQSNITAGTQDAVTVGGNTTVTGDGAVAVGTGSTVNGESSVAVGDTSIATGDNSVALGGNTTAEGDNTIAVGGNSIASDEGAVAVGGNTEASAQNAVAIGTGSSASTADSIAVGGGSSATGNHSTALGGNTIVNNNNSVALGYDSNASQDNVLSVGHKATDLDVNGNAYGTDLTRRIVNVANGTTATDVATVGQTYILQNSTNTTVADVGTNSIGQHIYQMTVKTDGQVVSGNTGIVTGGTVYDALEARIGQITVQNDAQNTVALGDNSSVSGDGAVAVGSGSSGSGEGSVAIGDTSSSSGEGSVAVGTNTTAQSDNTVAIGTGSTVTGTNSNNSVAIGQQTSVTGSNSVALGGGSSVTGSDSVALGGGSSVTGFAATAVGKNTVVNNDNSVALGSGSNASQDNVVSVGHSATDLDATGTAYGSDLNRRIVNVADAVNAHDAVTKGQMDALMADHVGTLATNGNYILKDNTTSANITLLDTQLKSAVDSIGTLSNNAVAYSSETKDAVVYGGTNGTVLRNVKGGAVTQTSMEAVNGSQLYAVKQDITGFASDIQANATNIDNLNSSVTAALSSVSASGLLVDSLDSSKADKSLSNLSDAGKRVLKTYAEDAVASYLAEQGLAVPAAPMAINTTNSNTLAVTNAGNGSLHVGEGSYVNGTSSIAIGVGNQVNANNSGAFGDPSIINADESYVLGNDNTINTGATGSFIVGNDGVSDAKGGLLFGSNTKATVEAEDAIGLGNRTEVSAKGAIALGSDSIADTENTLSIGNSNLKRKIVNVADGDISQNSSEAVTGAQLFVMNEKVQKNTEALEKKADVDAGNINVSDWATKLGVGKVENGNADLVTGGTVYDAIQGIKGNDLVQTNGDVITIGANNAASVIDVSDSMGQGRKITGVITDVNDATSAANVGYVNAITDNIVKSTNSAIQRVDNKVNKVGANAAAIANLPTPPFDGEEKWAFAAGVGHYQGETAGAVGAFYRPTDNVIARVSGSFGNGDEMVGAGVAVSLNKGNTPAVSKAQMVRTINAQAERIQSLESNRSADREQIERQNAVIANMQEAMVRMQEELAELKAK